MEHVIYSPARKRTFVAGSFETDAGNAIISPRGDGAMARTGVGVHTVTFDRDMGTLIAGKAGMDSNVGDQIVRDPVATVVNGVTVLTMTTIDISGGAAADTNGPRINWFALFSGEAV